MLLKINLKKKIKKYYKMALSQVVILMSFVQQNQPVNNTQNVGSTGMITQGNGANPDKGSVYEKLSDFA